MGVVQTLRPNANRSGAADFTVTGAGGVAFTALSDNSDTTFVQRTNATVSRSLAVELTSYTLPTGSIVGRVRVRARVVRPAQADYSVQLRRDSATILARMDFSGSAQAAPLQTQESAWFDLDSSLTQAQIDALYQVIFDNATTAGRRATFYEAYTDLEVYDKPTVTVNTPATGTALPDISWVYADGDGDPQTQYRVKVYDSATYSAGGFDPFNNAPSPTWETSGSGTTDTVTVGTPLQNGVTYRAYVRVAHAAGGIQTIQSDPAFAQWTTSFTAPTAPTVTATWNSTLQAVVVTSDGAALPGGLTGQTHRIERSMDGGTTWTLVRGAGALVVNGSNDTTVTDYEAVRGITARYRARADAFNAGVPVSSPWSTVATAVTASDGRWWFKAVTTPALNLGGVRVLASPEVRVEETVGIFRTLGGGTVAVSGDLYGEDGTFAVATSGTVEIAAVQALAYHQGVLLVQSPFGGHEYVRVTGRGRTIEGTAAAARSRWSLEYVEVTIPAVE